MSLFSSDRLSLDADDAFQHIGRVLQSVHHVGRHAEMTQRRQLVRSRMTTAVDVRHHVVLARLRIYYQLRMVVQEVHLETTTKTLVSHSNRCRSIK